jgi:hypothetical protein
MRSAEADGQGVLLFRHRNQVYVIAHQAVSENADSGLMAILLQQIQIDAAVSLGVEDDLPVGSALGDVMGKSGQNAPGCSRHTLVE